MKLVLIIIFSIFSLWGIGQNIDNCEPIRKGRYFYYAPNGGIVTVIRKRKKQIERYNNENQKFTFSINGIDSCSFELELTKVKGVDKILKTQIIGKKVLVKIVSSDLDEYKLEVADGNVTNKNYLTLYKN